jgi:prevent-host-death family protein
MNAINVGEARRRLSELISRAAAGERFLIRHRERPMAVLIDVAELERLQRRYETASRLARYLSQSEEVIQEIAEGKDHWAMVAMAR